MTETMTKQAAFNRVHTEKWRMVDKQGGSTWNDGGSWARWVFHDADRNEFWEVHLETDYRDEVTVREVVPRPTFAMFWDPVE